MFIFKAVWAVISAITILITVNTSPVASDTADAQLLSSETFVLNEALVMGQGISNDGEYYYTSGSIAAIYLTSLAKYDMETLECVEKNIVAIPFEYMQMGYNHIGGISYYNSKIYASVEGEPDDKYIASIMTFDAETLKFDGGYYPLPYEDYDDGVPWCAVDPDSGLLYASKWTDAKKIYVYDTANGMSLVKTLEISGFDKLDRIQGGEIYNGVLYLSFDCEEGNVKKVLNVNIETGETSLAFLRDVGGDNDIEAEGITVKTVDGQPVFCVLDYNKAIGVFLRSYKLI